MRNAGRVLAVLLLLSTAFARVNGAVVERVTFKDNVASFTVLNDSDRAITGFSVSLKATFSNGQERASVFTEDYGPLTGKALRSHETITETQIYAKGAEVVKMDATPNVVIYDDGTAETDSQEILDDTIAVRKKIAKALRLSADTLSAALAESSSSPSASARVRFERMLAAKDKDVDQAFLQTALTVAKSAPQGATERAFLQQNADRYAKEATAFEAYSVVRRP